MARKPAMPRGHVDRISRDGWVAGWCWWPNRPHAHAVVNILVDGVVVGTARADEFRPDLQAAGIGDGRHGFSFALPYASLAERGVLTVSVQEARTGHDLIAPATMRLGRAAETEACTTDLARQIRLLQGRINELRDAPRGARQQLRQSVVKS